MAAIESMHFTLTRERETETEAKGQRGKERQKQRQRQTNTNRQGQRDRQRQASTGRRGQRETDRRNNYMRLAMAWWFREDMYACQAPPCAPPARLPPQVDAQLHQAWVSQQCVVGFILGHGFLHHEMQILTGLTCAMRISFLKVHSATGQGAQCDCTAGLSATPRV